MTKDNFLTSLVGGIALLLIGILIGRSLQPDPPTPVDPRTLVQTTIDTTSRAVGDQTLRCLEAKEGSVSKEVRELSTQLAAVSRELADANKKAYETLLAASVNVEETVKRECVSRGRKR